MFAYDSQGMCDDFDGDWQEIEALFSSLCSEFNKETGLFLNIGYHNSSDEGSRYDDVDGFFWEVHGVYERTPAAVKNAELISPASYVIFG
jgi:hypothetical protein